MCGSAEGDGSGEFGAPGRWGRIPDMAMDVLEKIGDFMEAMDRELRLVRHEQQRQGKMLAELLADCPRCRAQLADTEPPLEAP